MRPAEADSQAIRINTMIPSRGYNPPRIPTPHPERNHEVHARSVRAEPIRTWIDADLDVGRGMLADRREGRLA